MLILKPQLKKKQKQMDVQILPQQKLDIIFLVDIQ